LREALTNLIFNAVDAMPAGGSITLRARSGADQVVVEVTDTGPGIPAAARARIFDRFYRVDGARNRPGAGLGLAIARWIVDEHHGTLSVDSNNSGPGSVFTVWLPTVVPPPPIPNPPRAAAPDRADDRVLATSGAATGA
jgi:two-component system sensor histidine kinase BaeS